jgi:hypothetical protein
MSKYLDKALVVVIAIAVAIYTIDTVVESDASLGISLLLTVFLITLFGPMIWAMWQITNWK